MAQKVDDVVVFRSLPTHRQDMYLNTVEQGQYPELVVPVGGPSPTRLSSQYENWPWPDQAQPASLAQPPFLPNGGVDPLGCERLSSGLGYQPTTKPPCGYTEAESSSTHSETQELDNSDSHVDEARMEGLFDLQWGSDPAFATEEFVPPRGLVTESDATRIWNAYMMTFFGTTLNILKADPAASQPPSEPLFEPHCLGSTIRSISQNAPGTSLDTKRSGHLRVSRHSPHGPRMNTAPHFLPRRCRTPREPLVRTELQSPPRYNNGRRHRVQFSNPIAEAYEEAPVMNTGC